MPKRELSRRDFDRLAIAALSGLTAGAGCSPDKPAAKPEEKAEVESPLLNEPHVCRGLNTCKGKGSDTCAGLAAAPTLAPHTCGGINKCKGQGGCGATPGENSCKGKGACSVPLMDEAWTKARARFEELMTKSGKKFGPAPAKAES